MWGVLLNQELLSQKLLILWPYFGISNNFPQLFWIILLNILDSIEWILFWINIRDFCWIESLLGAIQWKIEFSKRIAHSYDNPILEKYQTARDILEFFDIWVWIFWGGNFLRGGLCPKHETKSRQFWDYKNILDLQNFVGICQKFINFWSSKSGKSFSEIASNVEFC